METLVWPLTTFVVCSKFTIECVSWFWLPLFAVNIRCNLQQMCAVAILISTDTNRYIRNADLDTFAHSVQIQIHFCDIYISTNESPSTDDWSFVIAFYYFSRIESMTYTKRSSSLRPPTLQNQNAWHVRSCGDFYRLISVSANRIIH